MRRSILGFVFCGLCSFGFSQAVSSDEALLEKTRALYDAPFTRGLISFDCAVEFDWQKHFVDFLRKVPPPLIPVADRLQTVRHRIFVDRQGGVVSVIPKAPDLSGVAHAADLEAGLQGIFSSGLNAWLPFSTNVILPVGGTSARFEKLDAGYKLSMVGVGVAATILLKDDLRITSVVSSRPQPMRATTEFAKGPDGYLPKLLEVGNTAGGSNGRASFAYTYQAVDGFQLPDEVTVTAETQEVWKYSLKDCKAMKGIVIKGLPKQR